MKYLTDYTEAATTAAMERAQAFFAFSNQQLEEGLAKVGLQKDQVCSMGAGLIAAKDKADQLFKDLEATHKAGIAADIAENGKRAIIIRELHNHECFYTCDIEPCREALAGYDISEDEIIRAYRAELRRPNGGVL